MQKPPLFSIIIPAFNRGHTILPTLKSVLAQTVQDYECIIVDDGSDDGEVLAHTIASLNDTRFHYLHQNNTGGGGARNTGILAAKGTYISFLDSDDLFLPHKLEACLSHLTQDPKHAVYSRMYVDRGGDKKWVRPNRGIGPDEDMGDYLFVHNQFIQTSTIVMHREAALKTLFNPTLRKGQDLDFCLRLQHDGVHFTMVDEPLTIWVDQTDAGRTSRTRGYEAPLAWLEKAKPFLTKRSYKGYKATVLAYYMSQQKPFTAIAYLLEGLIHGVSIKVTLRQFARCFLPRNLYRTIVFRVVELFGK